MEQIFGTVERITFQNEETGFAVVKLLLPRKKDLVTIVGNLCALQPGEKVRCFGAWKLNAAHGMQFEVKESSVEAPQDIIGIQKYLGSGLIKGIGPHFAKKIIDAFGVKTLDVIDMTPEALLKVEGIGEKRVEKIKICWDEQKSIRSIMIFLQKNGIPPSFSHRIYKKWGTDSIALIEENPYKLAHDISGIGFKTADNMAQKLGFTKLSASRIDAGIEYVLFELSNEGHVCYPCEPFIASLATMLDLDPTMPLIQERLHEQAKQERIVVEDDMVALKGLYLSEKGIARELQRLKEGRSPLRKIHEERALEWVEKELYIKLAPNQKEAVIQSIQDKVHVITGGPGTGKSTITKAILAITSKLTHQIILAAPTGRAAKRMSEITKKEASTIHSLLQYNFKEGGFRRNRSNPLPCDLIIIDESSMIDTSLMYHLLKAIPTTAKVIFVGDIDQLPSVGPGNVLRDIIASQTIAVTILNKIFRQAAGSKIILNAHRINQGRFPLLEHEEKDDFFFLERNEPQEVLDCILGLVGKRLPQNYDFDPITDIQVLSPMKRGMIGTENLNIALQTLLNPHKEYFISGGTRFAPGDKVMQIRNNYTKEVYNGDIGILQTIDREEQELSICFDGKVVPYTFQELHEITLAYATSIHKYQGSEAPCVVIPCHTTHFMMLHKNLLYTGVTRGKKLVVLVGNKKAIAIAVGNDDVKKRYTQLEKHLHAICQDSTSD